MGLFSGKSGYGHIDRSTGRNRRDNLRWGSNTWGTTKGGPRRENGKVARKARLEKQRARKTRGAW